MTPPGVGAATARARRPWRGGAALLVALLLLPALAAGCSDPSGKADAATPAPLAPNLSLVASGGQFLTTCLFSHHATDDPIVHHGMPGMSHMHEFFGNTTTDDASTYATLSSGGSSCSDVGDHSAYWVPELFVNGRTAPPRRVDAYYRVAPGVTPASVQPFPAGLQVLAGNQFATAPQLLGIAGWACGMSADVHHVPPSGCTPDRPVQLRLTFPSCWNGTQRSSPDFTSHLRYPTASGCPASHPVAVPQLTLVVHYAVTGTVHEAHLASGSIDTAHGDFFDAWTPSRLAAQVHGCLNRAVVCGIVGGTFHTSQGSGDQDLYDLPS